MKAPRFFLHFQAQALLGPEGDSATSLQKLTIYRTTLRSIPENLNLRLIPSQL
jgi:hypothetical protein